MEKHIRKNYIDVLKGFGIFFVVFGHVTHNHLLKDYIWGFHMPLFFLLSGFLLNIKKYPTFKVFFISRIKSIYIPYVFFFLVTFVYWLLIERRVRGGEYSVTHQLFGLIYGTYEGNHLNFNGALWFLPCLLSVELMFYYVARIKSKTTIALWIVLFFLAGTLVKYFQLNYLPFGIHTAFFGIVFFGIGYISKNLEKTILNLKVLYKLIFLLLILVFQLLTLEYNLSATIETMNVVYIPVAISGILFYHLSSGLIKRNKILEFIGKNSLIILAFQEQTYRGIIFIFSKILNLDIEYLRLNIFICLLISLISIVSIIPMIIFYNKYIRVRIHSLFTYQ